MTTREIKPKPIRSKKPPVISENPNQGGESSPPMYYINKICSVFEGRGSATPTLEKAADYIFYLLQEAGLKRMSKDQFPGSQSTYKPYALAFSAACIGSLLAAIQPQPLVLGIAALLNDLALAGLIARSNFSASWMDWMTPHGQATNITGKAPAAGEADRKVLLVAHLDAHRTPIFYSTPTWQRLFPYLLAIPAASMAIGFLLYAGGFLMNWPWMRIPALVLTVCQLIPAILCWTADLSPYSPAANDNASGVAVLVRLAHHLSASPLPRTDVWLLVDDCEETACDGMLHFLASRSQEFPSNTPVIAVDEVGNQHLRVITRDGLLIRHKSRPEIVQAAESAAKQVSGFEVQTADGIAFTDATAAARMGYPAVSLVSHPDSEHVSYWHQSGDLPEHVDPATLLQAEQYILQLLKVIDAGEVFPMSKK